MLWIVGGLIVAGSLAMLITAMCVASGQISRCEECELDAARKHSGE